MTGRIVLALHNPWVRLALVLLPLAWLMLGCDDGYRRKSPDVW